MKQQGEGARATVRALGLAIALVLPGLTLAAVPQFASPAVDIASTPGMSMVIFNLHHG